MALKIDNSLNSIETLSKLAAQREAVPDTSELSMAAADGDSYISTVSDSEKPIHCEAYNNIVKEFAAARAVSMEAAESSGSDSSTSEDAKNQS